MADNPILRELLKRKLHSELAKHDAKERAWSSEQKRSHIETTTWVWLDAPTEMLHVEITTFELEGDRIRFAGAARGQVKFEAKGKIPNIAKASVKGSAQLTIAIAGSTRLEATHFADSQIDQLEGQLSDLTFNNDLLKLLRDPIQDALNDYGEQKREELKRDLAASLNDTTVL